MGVYPGSRAGILLPFWDDELEPTITHEVVFTHHQRCTGTRPHPCYSPSEAELEALRRRDIWIKRADTCFAERWYLTREQASYVAERVGRGEPVIVYWGRPHDCIRLVRDPARYTLRLPSPSVGPFAYLVRHNLPVPVGMPIPSEQGPYGPLASWYRSQQARCCYLQPGDAGVICSSCRLRGWTPREGARRQAGAGRRSSRAGGPRAATQPPLFA